MMLANSERCGLGCSSRLMSQPLGSWDGARKADGAAGAVDAVAPADAAEIDGVEEKRGDAEVVAARRGGDLPGGHRLRRAGPRVRVWAEPARDPAPDGPPCVRR